MNPDFRILATSASAFEIYSFNEVGTLMDTFYSPYNLPVRGITMDHFMRMSSSGPHNPSFVYSTSVDSDGHAGFYRQFLNGTGPVYITSGKRTSSRTVFYILKI